MPSYSKVKARLSATRPTEPKRKYTRKSASKPTGPGIQPGDEMPQFIPASATRTVTVQFAVGEHKRYAYNTNDPTIEVDDLCVVISPASYAGRFPAAGGYPTIVKVVSIKETPESISAATKWIVQKVDLASAVAAEERRQAIAVLDARIARETKLAMEKIALDRLRDLSPELDSLIKQRNELI